MERYGELWMRVWARCELRAWVRAHNDALRETSCWISSRRGVGAGCECGRVYQQGRGVHVDANGVCVRVRVRGCAQRRVDGHVVLDQLEEFELEVVDLLEREHRADVGEVEVVQRLVVPDLLASQVVS